MLPFQPHRIAAVAIAVAMIWPAATVLGQSPAVVGQWSGPWDWGVINPPNFEFGHAVLLLNPPNAGRLLIWYIPGTGTTYTAIWDPVVPQSLGGIASVSTNIFCSSHTHRSDGTILVCGGEPGAVSPPPPGCLTYPVDPQPCTIPGWAPGQIPQQCWPCTAIQQSWLFDPVTGTWTQRPSMNQSRYYPSQVAAPGGVLTNLAAGDPIVIGGTQDQRCGVEDPSYWSTVPTATNRHGDGRYLRGWEIPQVGTGAYLQLGPGAGPVNWPFPPTPDPYFRYFPQALLLSGTPATLLIAGDTHVQFIFDALPNPIPTPTPSCLFWHSQVQNRVAASYKLDIGAGMITQVGSNAKDRYYSSAVILHTLSRPNRVVRIGGSAGDRNQSYPLGHVSAPYPESVQEWDDTASAWVTKPGLTHPRLFQNAVILPTGQLFISGGSTTDYHNGPQYTPTQVPQCEIYDLGTTPSLGGTVATPPQNPRPRLYHSVAALLPDGRVASLGGSDIGPVPPNPRSRDSVEIYSPPYLFQGRRPGINSAPTTYTFTTPPGSVVMNVAFGCDNGGVEECEISANAVLIRPASVTHHFDTDQRYIELQVTNIGPLVGKTRNVTVTMPTDQTVAPPGYYMLFVIENTTGGRIPSAAWTIQLL
jgi:Domain of unknown function (DUF1929)